MVISFEQMRIIARCSDSVLQKALTVWYIRCYDSF